MCSGHVGFPVQVETAVEVKTSFARVEKADSRIGLPDKYKTPSYI